MMNTFNAPERIEIAGGYHWQSYGVSRDTGKTYGFLRFPDGKSIGVMYLHEAEQMAASMQPQVSASDEAMEQILDEQYDDKERRLCSHRQPAAVSADAVRMREALEKARKVISDEVHAQEDPEVPEHAQPTFSLRLVLADIDAALSPETVCKGE